MPKTSDTLNHLMQPASASDSAAAEPGVGAWSYGELDAEVDRIAGLLAGAGLRAGDVGSVVLPNGMAFLSTFMAVTRAGGVAAPLNPAYTAQEFEFYMRDSDARFVIAPEGDHACREAADAVGARVIDARLDVRSDGIPTVVLSERGAELITVADPATAAEGDVALFLHTSGTTSRPKGVPLRHVNLMRSTANIAGHYNLSPDDTSLIVMPMFHVHGLIGAVFSTLYTGGTVVMPPRFSASSFWNQRREYDATWYSAVPTIHQILLARADDDNAPHESFGFIRSCSAALAPAVFDNLESRFGAPVLEAYGMTEAAHQMSSSPMPPGDRYPGTVGLPTGLDVAVMSDTDSGQFADTDLPGEVVIRGEQVMWGYHNNDEANSESFVDGWFRTGDQGFVNSDGYLTLTGRLKELINRGGEKISPLEVDAALLSHPAVTEAVTFAAQDAKYGECVHAAVVLSTDADSESLRAHCADTLADFKVPDTIHIADNLPRTATGKIQRRHVAAAFTGIGRIGQDKEG